MKKIVSILLCLVMLASFVAMPAGAVEQKREYSEYPLVIVPGYSGSALYRIDENGEQVHVWGLEMEEIYAAVLKNIVGLGLDISDLSKGDGTKLGERVGKEFVKLYYDMACNDDGSSVYPLQRYCVTAEDGNRKNLFEKYNGETKFQHEPEIMLEYDSYIGQENIFSFNCDFRMGAEFCAGQLNEFIKSVKAYTGKDKVNIFAISHGGQVTGTYLTLYGEQGDVHNAVMEVPALAGAGLAYGVLNGDIHFDEYGLMTFVEHGMMEETDLNWLTKANKLGFLDEVLNAFAPYALQIMGNWGSIWDFCPTEFYEEMKEKNLDPVANAEIIKKSDRMHYEIMTDFANGFKRARAAGTRPFIIAGYDNKDVLGLEQSSDGIITIASSTGATVAPLGKRFNDGYTQKVDTGFYQVSPSMTVDASTAYMPEHTWFVENFYHGMVYKDPFTAELMKTLVLTDEIENVHSNPAFPQFHATTNPSHAVFASFNKSVEGYVNSNDTALIVKNLSVKSKMKLLSIGTRGIELSFLNSLTSKVLEPGESIEIPFSGEIPEISKANFDLSISYILLDNPTPLGERVLNFTIMNGEAPEYNESEPLVDATLTNNFSEILNSKTKKAFKNAGIYELMEMLFNTLYPLVSWVFKYFGSYIK